MPQEEAQRNYDNETPEDYETTFERCKDCGQHKCVCNALDGYDE